jgi:hypothetical protein
MFKKIRASSFDKKPIYLYRQENINSIKALLTGGMHRYENSSQHLYNLMKHHPKILRKYDLYIIPEVNPCNFLGLNRALDHVHVPAEYQFLKELNPFELAVDFHGDFEDVRFYLYERHKPGERNLSQKIFRKVVDYIPVRGYAKVTGQPENTMEEFNYKLGSRYSITTETPLHYFRVKKSQVRFNEDLAKIILETYAEMFEQKNSCEVR